MWKVFTSSIENYPAMMVKLQEEWTISMVQFIGKTNTYYITCHRPDLMPQQKPVEEQKH